MKEVDKEDTEFYNQYEEAEEFNQSIASNSNVVSPSSYTIHPQAIYTSRLLDYKNLPKPQNSKEINIQFYAKFSGNLFWSYIILFYFLCPILINYNLDSLQMDFEKLDSNKGIYLF